MQQAIDMFKSLLEPASVLVILAILLVINIMIFNRLKTVKPQSNIIRNTISSLIVFIGALVFILALPIPDSLKGQVLTFLGIIISAGIALSSTTILGNLIAGLMNNSMKRFRNGELIKIGDLQGRITRKSIFRIEIQLEDSNFVSIPNLYIANNPVKLTRKTNTVVSATVSLGYDVPRRKIEEALKDAAIATGLKDPYVYIMNLGDFSVTYKISGFLDDSGKYFTTSSNLNGRVMDKLHEKKIEIVSPTFMNQRRADEFQFIPEQEKEKPSAEKESSPEDLIFDEAIKSGMMEKKKDFLVEIEKKIELLKKQVKESKDQQEADSAKRSITRYENLRDKVKSSIEGQQDEGADNS
jgi:small-conductance mechanosensitive channel